MPTADRLRVLLRTPAVLAAILVAVCTSLYAADRTSLTELQFDWLEDTEQRFLDLHFALRGPVTPGPEVVVVAIDDATLSQAPDLLERRSGLAQLIHTIVAQEPKVLAVDIQLAEPEQLLDRLLVEDIIAYLDEMGDAAPPRERELLARVREVTMGDEILEESLTSDAPVVLSFGVGQYYVMGSSTTVGPALDKSTFDELIAGSERYPGGERVYASLPRFHDAAAASGLVVFYTDRVSGRVWEAVLAIQVGERAHAALSLSAIAQAHRPKPARLAYVGTRGVVRIGDDVEIPTENGRTLINYRGPRKTFPHLSAAELVDSGAGEELLKDRIVLLGVTHILQDRVSTPFGPDMPGVEVHANLIDSFLRGDSLLRAPPWLDVLFTLLSGLLVCLVFVVRLSPAARFGVCLLLAGGIFGVTHIVFLQMHRWVALAAPLGVVAVSTVLSLAASYLREGLQKRQLKSTFSRYLSAELLDEMLKDPSRAGLSGERRELSVLFTDIRGFTTFSEQMTALDLAAFLNRYFEPMTRAVLDSGGYLDKYIGDAIMAIFGAPVPRSSHAGDACRAAVRMFHSLDEVRSAAGDLGVQLEIGAGINSGEMVVGNLGSEARFDYTVIGDPVNVASRVEGLTKRYGVFCLVGSRTVELAGPEWQFRPVDLVRVKGKLEPEFIHELCSGPEGTVASYAELEAWSAGLDAWRAGDFKEARVGFERFRAANPDDTVAQVYLDRLDDLDDTPPEGWDGVFVHATK